MGGGFLFCYSCLFHKYPVQVAGIAGSWELRSGLDPVELEHKIFPAYSTFSFTLGHID